MKVEKLFFQNGEQRFKRFGKYKIDRLIFQLCLFAILGWLLFVAWSYDFSLDYFDCPANTDGSISGNKLMLKGHDLESAVRDGMCKNPFYKESWKNQEYLLPGEYGTKPGPLFNSVNYLPFIVLGLGLLLNHWLHNKKYRFEVRE